MTKTLKIENIYVGLLWICIFMGVLPWDQEKIVVINLIIFLYCIYFFYSSTISDTLNQKKEVILNILTADLSKRVKFLNHLIQDYQILIKNYSLFIYTILNKQEIAISNYISTLIATKTVNSSNIFSVTNNLFFIFNASISKKIQHNMLISKYTLETSLKALEGSTSSSNLN